METNRRFLLPVAGVVLAVLLRPASSLPPSSPPENPLPRVTLFSFDDHSIRYKENLKLSLVSPEEFPDNPVLRHGPAGSVDEADVTFYRTVIRVGQKFRMWYVAGSWWRYDGGIRRRYFQVAYAESDDGIRWTIPVLGLTPFKSNTRNNLVPMTPPVCVQDHWIQQPSRALGDLYTTNAELRAKREEELTPYQSAVSKSL